MIVTAWNDGKHHASGAGYGVKIAIADRDHYFDRRWTSVLVRIGDSDHAVDINIAKVSFWNDTCHELICKDIGAWLRDKNLAPWPKGQPPKLKLVKIQENIFQLNL